MNPRNSDFIADASNHKLTDATIRANFKAGHYGPVRADYAKGWWKMAGRAQ